MEFKITTDLSQIPATVEFNFEELKADLAPRLGIYKNLLVTPDTIKEAKDDKAKLNKLRAAIEDKRKEIKKACMTPYEAFEVQCKEIVRMIDEPIKSIDEQIKTFEEQERKAKYERLEAYFMDCVADVDISIAFDRVLNPKWANKGMKEATLQQEICDRVIMIQKDFGELTRLYADSPHLTAVLGCYMQDYDKSAALAYAATLVQQEAQRAAKQAHSAPEPEEVQVYTETPQNAVSEPQKLISGTFRVRGTKAQIIALRDFMKQNGIHFEIVKEKE